MKLLILAAILVVAVTAIPLTNNEIEREWQSFKDQFRSNKALYVNEAEETYRRSVFKANYQQIVKHNEEADNGQHTYWLGVNQFSDLTDKEFEQMMLSPMTPLDRSNIKIQEIKSDNVLASTLDYRTKGMVARVKNQGQCGSCWAFAAVAATEGQYAKKYDRIQELSEQNLVDCTKGTSCTTGGNYAMAYQQVINEGGLETEEDYPYTSGSGTSGSCKFTKSKSAVTIENAYGTQPHDADQLQQALSDIGPLAVVMNASGPNFRGYSRGVYSNSGCLSGDTQINHGVTVVGYGTEDGMDYWLVKNSWATSWGDQGYFKIQRGVNRCGIEIQGVWPTGVTKA
ncbi:uncharacterized protein LOC128954977 [Oppia nitens]|uniref:uncharacterized protein LOC128954977 n=1 Tax=Oppia nitens TaxID=1686743 RepID=UPI0023DA0131|nr:uncharacterized protein LOC128954977 [Oppia nitens]